MSTAPAPVPHGGARRRLPGTLGAIGLLLLAAILVMLLVDRVFFAHTSTPAGTGSGVASTQARPASRFTAVDLAGFNNVVVRAGARQSVVVHADSNLLTRVTTRVRAGRLVIGTTPGNLAAKSPMYVVVTLPSVEAITPRGSGAGTILYAGNPAHIATRVTGDGTIAADDRERAQRGQRRGRCLADTDLMISCAP